MIFLQRAAAYARSVRRQRSNRLGGHIHPASYAVRRRLAATLLVTVLCGTACQTWHTQRVAPESLLATRQPTKVRVTLTDGSQLVLEHPVLRGDTLIEPRYTLSGAGPRHSGEHDVRIPLADVRELATRGFSAGRTVGLGVGVAAALYAAFLVASAIACSGNACY